MIRMQGVTKKFGSFTALDALTLNAPKGSVYGLVGPNGAGKSTAIRCLTGVYRPEGGEVTIGGEAVWENTAVKARVGYIPDEFFFFPSASLQEMRKYYRGIYPRFDDGVFAQLTKVFALPEKSAIRRFSKGMQKQAAFMLAVAQRPEILILDEPVDGLDPVMRRQVWSLVLADVARYEATVLVSSHNLRELEDVCDHVGIMDHGRMLLERSLADMQGSTVKLQIADVIPEGLEILHQSTSGRLSTLVVRGSAEEISARAAAAGSAYFDVLPLSLEEIFIYELGGADYAVKDIVL